MENGWRTIIREPLVHFLIAGLAIFLFNGWRGGPDDISDRSITVDEAKAEYLARQWEMAWQRAPNAQELDNLIRDDIKEEIYYREAVRLGLDKNDPIIRRRLRSKMEFLATSQVENAEPTDAELQAFFEQNKAHYATDAIFTFDQIYFADDLAAANAALAQIKAGQRVKGRSISLPPSMVESDTTAIARQFGDGFAKDISDLPIGEFAGPVQSGFGWHIVKIHKVNPAYIPELSTIRQDILDDWRIETKAKREAAAYQALLDGYKIKIAKP